jgi:hypothetical protein
MTVPLPKGLNVFLSLALMGWDINLALTEDIYSASNISGSPEA